jgi:glycosyltransferase involved in cell wall biosynthesis
MTMAAAQPPTTNHQPPTRIAILTPLPPTKSGVAHYSSIIIPALRDAIATSSPLPTADCRLPTAVDAFQTLEAYDPAAYDVAIYQLGNNPHHEVMYREAMRRPGVVVLHDLVLHHLIVEMTLARGDVEGYVAALEANHGPAGAAWARGRAVGLHIEMANFLLPASVDVARRSRAVIVHNDYAADRLRSFGVTTPIHVVPHPFVPHDRTFDIDALRAKHGFTRNDRVIGFFGFLTSAKRADVVLEAFRIARAGDARLKLLIVGEPAPNIDLEALRGEGIVTTGYVADHEFPAYYASADRHVNLRYPSAGESSGTLVRAFEAGKPVAVSDYAQFAEFPDDCVFKVPLGAGEVERLVAFFVDDLPDPSRAQRRWLEENATLEKAVAGYLAACTAAFQAASASSREDDPAGRLPAFLFPQLTLVETSAHAITLRNDGHAIIRTRTYGQPEYRLIAQVVAGGRVVDDRWLALPRDVAPGESVTVDYTPRAAGALRLYHALQDIPLVEVERVR